MPAQEPCLQRVHIAPQEKECATQACLHKPAVLVHAEGLGGGSIHDKALFGTHAYFHKGRMFCPCCCQIPTPLTEIDKAIFTEGPPARETTYGKGKPHALSPSPQLQSLPQSPSPLELATKISSPYQMPQTQHRVRKVNLCFIPCQKVLLHPIQLSYAPPLLVS